MQLTTVSITNIRVALSPTRKACNSVALLKSVALLMNDMRNVRPARRTISRLLAA